jgi:DNA-binding MarR family transcriptional regulator
MNPYSSDSLSIAGIVLTRYLYRMKQALDHIDLLLRAARLTEAGDWDTGLNPAQAAALAYLARANRFSRAPSHLAEWLGTTRGTVSQSLKSLAARGLVQEQAAPRDRRSISYALTDAGLAALSARRGATAAAEALGPEVLQALELGLTSLLRSLLERNGKRAFGLCLTCRHHQTSDGAAGFCTLLSEAIPAHETQKICIEHAA